MGHLTTDIVFMAFVATTVLSLSAMGWLVIGKHVRED